MHCNHQCILTRMQEEASVPSTPSVQDAPQAVGPYAQAIAAGGFVFCSGQTPLVPASMRIEADNIEDQTRQALTNLGTVLSSRGLGLADVVKTTVFLKNFADFSIARHESLTTNKPHPLKLKNRDVKIGRPGQ